MPESGAWLPNTVGAIGGGAEDLVHERELDLAEPLAAELGRQVGGPQPAALDLLLEGRDDLVQPVVVSSSRIVSSGHSSRLTNSVIQSRCSWNSGSVEKSQATPRT